MGIPQTMLGCTLGKLLPNWHQAITWANLSYVNTTLRNLSHWPLGDVAVIVKCNLQTHLTDVKIHDHFFWNNDCARIRWICGTLMHWSYVFLTLTHWYYIYTEAVDDLVTQDAMTSAGMGLLPDTQNRGLRMCRECRERFPRHRLQRKPLVSDPGMHQGTCVMHVPWCM